MDNIKKWVTIALVALVVFLVVVILTAFIGWGLNTFINATCIRGAAGHCCSPSTPCIQQ